MTCIVGLKWDDDVYIAGDSCLSQSHDQQPNLLVEKVFRIGPEKEYIVGFVGDLRTQQIIRYNFKPPQPKFLDFSLERMTAFLAGEFVDELRKTFKRSGQDYRCPEDHTENFLGNFLLNFHTHLFQIGGDYCVVPCGVYDAIGAGSSYAVGSMYAMYNRLAMGLQVDALIRLAMNSAKDFSSGVLPPYLVLKNKSKDNRMWIYPDRNA